MHGNLLLLYIRWMLHVGSMELHVEWVQEKGTFSSFCSLMNTMFATFAVSTLCCKLLTVLGEIVFAVHIYLSKACQLQHAPIC